MSAPGADGVAPVASAAAGHVVVAGGPGRRFAFPLDFVRSVLAPLPLTWVPGAPSGVLGLAALAGRPLTVLDGCALLGDETLGRRQWLVFAAPWAHLALSVGGTVECARIANDGDDAPTKPSDTESVLLEDGERVRLLAIEPIVAAVERAPGEERG